MEKDVLLPKVQNPKRKSKRRKFVKISGIGILIVLGISLVISCTVGTRRSYFTLNKNNAHWVTDNGEKYLYIEAENEYELGRLEGKYLSAKIANLKRIIQLFGMLNSKHGFGYSNLIKLAQQYETSIPNEYKEEMRGIDRAIVGVSYNDILLQNCFVDILYGHYFPQGNFQPNDSSLQMGCTVVGFLNNDSITIGQNFDFNNVFKHTLAFVYHKVQGKYAQFGLKVGGILSIPCGTNSKNVSIFVNVVKTNIQALFTTPIAFRTRLAFDSATDPEEFRNIITSEDSSLSMNLLIANNTKMISIQCVPGNYSISRPDQCVNTNTYTDAFFQEYLQDKTYSKNRQNITESLLSDFSADLQLSDSEFISIMSDSRIYQSNSGIMGISTLTCSSTKFFCKGIPSPLNDYPSIPFFF